MFRINRMTDYAVVVLVDMARRDGVRAAQQLSEDTGVPLPTVAKLMKSLCHADLVASTRGAGGGYTLSRAPSDISVAHIIEAVEGPIAINACVDDNTDDCGLQGLCSMHGNWERINQVIRRALRDVSLAEMCIAPPNPFLEAPHGGR